MNLHTKMDLVLFVNILLIIIIISTIIYAAGTIQAAENQLMRAQNIMSQLLRFEAC